MEVFADVLRFIATNIFNEVAILIGIITLIGLLLQRKPVEDVVAGALRATIGVIILFIGVDVFVQGLVAFQTIVASAVGLEPPEATNTLGDFLGTHGGTVALIITVGFFLHLLAVRLLDTRYVYLTGHLMFWISVITTAALVQVFGDVDQLTLVLVGSVVVAAYWTIQPLYIAPLMRRVTGGDEWGYGHTSSAACWMAGKIGPLVGSRERHDTERLRLPKQLSFFKDVNVSTALVIGVILIGAMIFADRGVIAEQAAAYDEEINPWVWGIIAALRFAAGIAILLFGVRMFLAEIVPAFKGVSEKLIPGSRPALDAPTVFPFAPTAVMIGFVAGTAVFLAFMGLFAALGLFVLVPPMIMLFFPGAAAAVFGNAFGGWRGAVIGGVINGTFLAVGQAVTWGMLSDTAPELATLADPDWYILIWAIMLIAAPLGALGEAAIWGVPAVVLAIFAGWLYFIKRRHPEPEAEIRGEAPFERPDTTGESEEDDGRK
ncbi:PTS ascorbate transporter subunit IIC [Rubrobacter taiwanensis]|uniref:Ascorbate-specific PTS system EIIC component n=1 Tax=Rubrobacter taiwanensis TaxID=185139 RepID=A0A4V2NVU1_9ACTN|nr:PTS ascorbate transporter subunit IIC [Rubrobacter taiwanensis]TCJ14822.1 PTS ascorbate transporter subunit IIC [Rubrobacter taiwanensis]